MIAPATAALAPALAAIHAACFAGPDAWSADALAALLASPGVSGLVHSGGGFILLRAALDEADIVTMAVDPSVRRQGIASTLLAAALAHACACGITSVFLEVAEQNQAAIGLYRSHGFTQAGLRPRYYADGANALLLRLPLT
jgi:ribosomal-protein-alanine N-acetyltransferase